MTPQQPTDAELTDLARQVDDQFAALLSAPTATVRFRTVSAGERTELPGAPPQQALIEQTTREPFETFWPKYRRALRRDLCLPGGLLHDKWQK